MHLPRWSAAGVLAALIAVNVPAAPPAFQPQSMAYVLQGDSLSKNRADAVKKLAASERDVVVIDYSHSGAKDGKWTAAEIDGIRKGKAGRKVVAYISIGEAEDYRDYWKKEWDPKKTGKPTAAAPGWLNQVNPEWKGNYKVRYWHKDWQQIILRYVDQIIAQGFNGIYLDIVDGFEFYEHDPKNKTWIDNRKNPETGNTYRQDMIKWVQTIADHARKTKPSFLIIPQNGSQLLADAGFLKTIDAIGIEDLFTDGKKKQPADHTQPVLASLKLIKQAGKPVLLIEYPTNAKLKQLAQDGAKQNGLVLLITDRQLKTLGVAGGK